MQVSAGWFRIHRMKVLLVNVHGLPVGYIGAYGNDWIETPVLDSLAAEGIVFDAHIADRPDPSGACPAWRTGCYDLPDEALTVQAPSKWFPDVLDQFRAANVPTMLVHDGRRTPSGQFLAGWDRGLASDAGEEEDPLSSTVEASLEALEWLEKSTQGLLCVDIGTLLPPWRAPAEFAEHYFGDASDDAEEEPAAPPGPLTRPLASFLDSSDMAGWQRLQRSYAGLVTYVDTGLGALWDAVRERGVEDEICLIITADHGFPLGEHKLVGFDRPWLHEERVHVPLLIRLPGALEATRRVLALTQPVDLAPTLLDLFGLPPVAMHGRSLMPLWQGRADPVRPYAISGLRVGERTEWALRTPDWVFLLPVLQEVEDQPRPRQLYVKPADRWELNNLVQHHAALADQLELVLREFFRLSRQARTLEPPAIKAE